MLGGANGGYYMNPVRDSEAIRVLVKANALANLLPDNFPCSELNFWAHFQPQPYLDLHTSSWEIVKRFYD